MYMRILLLAVLVFTMTAFAQVSPGDNAAVTVTAMPGNYGYQGDWFQVKYFPNLGIPSGAYINMTNTGRQGSSTSGVNGGNICVNVYAFNAAEEMFACCNCMITPDGLRSLNVFTDLVGKALTPSAPSEAVVKLVALTPPGTGKTCPSTPSPIPTSGGSDPLLARGLRAWGTALHSLPTSPVTYGITETEFSMADLGFNEATNLNTYCSVIQIVGSGYGTCNSCAAKGLGASVQ
jgi:hypothetical protein